jgi:hypothetical protein
MGTAMGAELCGQLLWLSGHVPWMQRLVLYRPIPALIKFLFVFLATTLLSWASVQAALRIPKVGTVL